MTASHPSPGDTPARIRQTCVVPFRRQGERIELCLITSLKRRRWIFPKGIVDPGETSEEAGLKEAFEEAGLHGRILGQPLGVYQDAKWGAELSVTVFVMAVERSAVEWPESAVRERRWVDPERAAELLSKPQLRTYLAAALERLPAP